MTTGEDPFAKGSNFHSIGADGTLRFKRSEGDVRDYAVNGSETKPQPGMSNMLSGVLRFFNSSQAQGEPGGVALSEFDKARNATQAMYQGDARLIVSKKN